MRDLPSRVVDSVFAPLSWGDRTAYYWVAQGIDVVDTRARLLPLDSALERVYDKYGFIRDAYLQQRNYVVHDGNVPEEPVDEELEGPDPSADDAAGEAATPPADGDDAAAGDESGTQPVTPAPTP